MLFLLTDEVGNVESWSLEDAMAIEKVAHCAFEGSHVVLAESPEVVHKLLAASQGTFGAVTTAVLRKLAADFAFQGWLLGSEVAKVAITTPATVDDVRKRWPRVLSLAEVRAMTLDPTTLLAENLVDAKVFAIAGKHYIAAEKLRGLEIAAITRGGGGSTITHELSEIVARSDRVCLALTDSDSAWPGAEASDTGKKCAALVSKTAAPIEHKSIPVREIENLVSPAVMIDLVTGADQVDAVRDFERLCQNVPEARSCGDIKDGVVASRVYRLPQGAPERDFLRGLHVWRHGLGSRCVREEDCEKERSGANCDCTCIPKIGRISTRFGEWLEQRSPTKALESFQGPWRKDWLTVGTHVFQWCCSRPRMRG